MAFNSTRPPHMQELNVPHMQELNVPPHLQELNVPPHLQTINVPQLQGLNVPPLNSMPYMEPTDEEWRDILSDKNTGISLPESAPVGTMGPLLGKMDIGASEDSYIFRVSLPGVAREDFTCDVSPDGQILIKGVTTTGEKTVYKHSLKFEMQSQNLCPPGLFSISFKLPGPVDPQHFTAHFGIDGVFEGLVKKKIATS